MSKPLLVVVLLIAFGVLDLSPFFGIWPEILSITMFVILFAMDDQKRKPLVGVLTSVIWLLIMFPGNMSGEDRGRAYLGLLLVALVLAAKSLLEDKTKT